MSRLMQASSNGVKGGNGHRSTVAPNPNVITFTTGDATRTIVIPDEPLKNYVLPGDTPQFFPEVPIGPGLTAQLCHPSRPVIEAWLSKMGRVQRAQKEAHKRCIRYDLVGGRWVFNAAPIIFDWDGNLIDGQHRLTEMLGTGIMGLVLVIRGVDPFAYSTIDITAKRSGGDALRGRGVKNHTTCSAICLAIWKLENGFLNQSTTSYNISPAVIEEVFDAHPGVEESAAVGMRCKKACHSPTAPGFCHWRFSRIDRDAAEVFMDRLATGVGLSHGDPILLLRNRFDGPAPCKPGERGTWHANNAIYAIHVAWNQWRRGRTGRLVLKDDEPIPTPV